MEDDVTDLLLDDSPEGVPDNLSQEETTRKIEAELKAKTDTPPADNSAEIYGIEIPETIKDIPEPWKVLYAQLSNDTDKYEIPNAIITGKNEDGTELTEIQKNKLFIEEVRKNTTAEIPQDPFIARLQIAKLQGENFNYSDFLANEKARVDVLNLPDETYMKLFMKQTQGKTEENPNGFTDEDIDAWIQKQDKITMATKVKEMKTQYLNDIAAEDEKIFNEYYGNTKKSIDDQNKELDGIATEYLKSIEPTNEFHGIPFDEVTKKDFSDKFREWIKRSPETGINKFEEYQQSDDNFKKLAPIFYLVMTGKLQDVVKSHVDNIKKQILEKLGIESEAQISGGRANDDIDIDALLTS